MASTFCEFFGCGSGSGPSVPAVVGDIVNLLSVDYEDDWVYLEGIEDLGFVFSPQRATSLIAPTSGVKGKRASPRHSEVAVAASTFGYESDDMVFVVFAETLMTSATPIKPYPGDKIVAFDYSWVIKSVQTNVDFSQYRCYCRRSVTVE